MKKEIFKEDFLKRAQHHPELLERFERLLSLVEDSQGDLQKANEAEQRVIQELQQMGNEVLAAWGRQQVSQLSEAQEQEKDSSHVGKKNFGGILVTVKSF